MKKESICNYNQFVSYIKEELIRTLISDEVIDLLDRKLDGFNFKLTKRHKTQFKIEIKDPDKNLDYYKYIFSICIRCGYFCSYYKILTDDQFIRFKGKFDKEKFINTINKYNITYVELIFEGDYDENEYSNKIEIPDILYHLSPLRYKDSIMKIGLCPSEGMKNSYHPKRIYFIEDCINKNWLVEDFKYNDFKYFSNNEKYKNIPGIKDINSDFYKYILLKIDTKLNNLKDNLILNRDPNFQTTGYFTTNNIPKENIKIIEENL